MLSIGPMPRSNNDEFRTPSERLSRRHGRAHPEFARFIGGRSDDATPVGRSADDEGLTLEARIELLFD